MLLILDEKHKKHLEFLSGIDSKVVKEFCRIAIENLQKGANPKLYQTAAQKLNVEVDLVQNAVSGVAYLYTEAAKMKVNELEFRDSILILGFSEESQQEIVKLYFDSEQKIRSFLSSFDIAIPYYHNLEWRLEAQIASRSLCRPSHPLVMMRFEFDQDGKRSHTVLQTDPINLMHMTEVLEQALQEAKSQHARRIMRNVK